MEPLDKAVIGERIKFLRKSKGLRQWQMAQLLGATQPAVHKYENGILPEVKRLLEIARIGNTSIEWILTGRHWENGATQIDRLDAEVYDLAYRLKALTAEDRRVVSEALEILRAAIGTLKGAARGESLEAGEEAPLPSAAALDGHALAPLAAALSVYDAVVTTLANEKSRELSRFGRELSGERPPEGRLDIPPLQKNAG